MSSRYLSIVILTGAGISQESGLNTFRGDGGLWEGHRVEDVATPEAFQRDPEMVHNFYNMRRRGLLNPAVLPNPAHKALAEFEEAFSGTFTLITQNIDNLHERAGSKNVLHIHGELLKARCVNTQEIFEWKYDLTTETPHPTKKELKGTLRPHIVWFGEMPFYLDEIASLLNECDLFVAIGTSGLVYPAAGFVQMAPASCNRVLINLDATPNTPYFDEVVQGKASHRVPEFFNSLIE